MLADYRCWDCKYRWKDTPGWQNSKGEPNYCPRCEAIFFDWLNWKAVVEWARRLEDVRKQSTEERDQETES